MQYIVEFSGCCTIDAESKEDAEREFWSGMLIDFIECDVDFVAAFEKR